MYIYLNLLLIVIAIFLNVQQKQLKLFLKKLLQNRIVPNSRLTIGISQTIVDLGSVDLQHSVSWYAA